ncbi:hypothetical protein PVAP13_4NG061400 [Panicum virgatum]|uniref:Uncharacterized protein n=1 Tax=Panicum virgatum TaxID=38727 RepID=A0A8T0T416_PANVG|nr:hypothetical protein PVAP13_4NG061400 [Panicum virgatum]
MGIHIHKVILALAVILLMSGQLTAGAGAIVLDARPSIPISDVTGMKPYGEPKRNSGRSAPGVIEDKGYMAARGYFLPPTLPPCRRMAC